MRVTDFIEFLSDIVGFWHMTDFSEVSNSFCVCVCACACVRVCVHVCGYCNFFYKNNIIDNVVFQTFCVTKCVILSINSYLWIFQWGRPDYLVSTVCQHLYVTQLVIHNTPRELIYSKSISLVIYFIFHWSAFLAHLSTYCSG